MNTMKIKVGDKIRVIAMKDEPNYTGREGKVTMIDGAGQLHGTWGGLAIIPEEDVFEIVKDISKNRLEILLSNAIVMLVNDGYEKEKVKQELGITEEELNYLFENEDLEWTCYD